MPVIFGEQVPVRATSNVRPLPPEEKRNHLNFMLMLHPERYRWDPIEGDWLPELGRLTISGGVGGVGISPSGQEIVGNAMAAKSERGWIIFQDGDSRFSDPKFGLVNGKYLARHPAAPHGHAFSFVWEGYERVRDIIEWSEDRGLRVRFQRACESSTLVPAMSPKLMELDIRDQLHRVRRLGDKRSRNPNMPSISVRAEEAETMLKAMEIARDKRLGKPAALAKSEPNLKGKV